MNTSPIRMEQWVIKRSLFSHDLEKVGTLESINVQVNIRDHQLGVKQEDKQQCIVQLHVDVRVQFAEFEEPALQLDAEYLGFFKLESDLKPDEASFHRSVSASSMLYGMIRAHIDDLSLRHLGQSTLIPSVMFNVDKKES